MRAGPTDPGVSPGPSGLPGQGRVSTVVIVMKRNPDDFSTTPFSLEGAEGEVKEDMGRVESSLEVERLKTQVTEHWRQQPEPEYDRIFGASAKMKAIKEVINQAADTDATILVWGQSGTGKELIARTIHQCSPRSHMPFVKVNCAALPMELLESELFGYERGAFTGAYRRKPGKFELADGGTIFLDEIGEVPPPLQAKLLQVLQDREFSRLGGRRDIRVDVRTIASTNKDLARAVADKTFRDDLYYRLNIVNIFVPPLRERREEIPSLVEYFGEKYSAQYNRYKQGISTDSIRLFMEYSWPGNVRELENIVKRIVILQSEDWIESELRRAEDRNGQPAELKAANWVREEVGLKEITKQVVQETERAVIKAALDSTRWNRVHAARRLKISYKALLYKIQGYGLAKSN